MLPARVPRPRSTVATVIVVLFGGVHGGEVLKLDPSSINESLAEFSPLFVKFFAPWCRHCRDMAPAWTALATQELDGVKVGEVDCTKKGAEMLTKRFGVHGFPTLLLFVDGGAKIFKHEGDRTLRAMAAFAKGGWKDQAEHDPTAPPKKRRRSLFSGYAAYILIGLLCFSCVVGLCCTMFGPEPSSKGKRPRGKRPAQDETPSQQQQAASLRQRRPQGGNAASEGGDLVAEADDAAADGHPGSTETANEHLPKED